MIKQSRALVFSLNSEGLIGYNYLTKSAFSCDPDSLAVILQFNSMREIDVAPDSIEDALIAVDALVETGSAVDKLEQEYVDRWDWGTSAALFHFSLLRNQYLSAEETEKKQIAAIAQKSSPPLTTRNTEFSHVVTLPSVVVDGELLETMASRRTVRAFQDIDIRVEALSEMLLTGLGVTGYTRNCVCELPLKMTPSGGARNPFEAYVFVRAVTGVPPGVYHYSAAEHSLGLVQSNDGRPLSEFAGGQLWADNAPCLVVLCANFERVMWKYDDPNGYRVALIEAGHIGQNMMLSGTKHGLTVCPTAALSHDNIFEALNLPSRITSAPIYAFAIGVPDHMAVK